MIHWSQAQILEGPPCRGRSQISSRTSLMPTGLYPRVELRHAALTVAGQVSVVKSPSSRRPEGWAWEFTVTRNGRAPCQDAAEGPNNIFISYHDIMLEVNQGPNCTRRLW